MIVLLDHDDSFVHTLARYIAELGGEPTVITARRATVAALRALRPTQLILSPGPGRPEECGIALELLRQRDVTLPILGVCLGHQCIAHAFGAEVDRSAHPMHGSTSRITHDGDGVYRGLPNPLTATRYHSLSVKTNTLPQELVATAHANDGVLMGIRHRFLPIEGVQFHPESVLTQCGHQVIANFLTRSAIT